MVVIFKLFRCERCFGDQGKRETIQKTYLMSHKKMDRLIRVINASVDGDKYSYYIEKYIYDIQKIRKMSYFDIVDGKMNHRIVYSKTWEKYVYDLKDKVWRASNYRYHDELLDSII